MITSCVFSSSCLSSVFSVEASASLGGSSLMFANDAKGMFWSLWSSSYYCLKQIWVGHMNLISHSKNQISFTVNSKKVSTLASICKKLLWCVSSAPRVCGAGLSIWSIYFKTPNNKIVYQELQIWRETIEIYWKLSDKSRNGKKCTFIWRDRGSGIFWAVSCAIL